MNKKASIASIKEKKQGLFFCFYFFVGTIISFYLSISISNYFYFLAVPLLLITLFLVKLLITSIKDEYKRLIKKEKYFNNGRHLEYYSKKKKQIKFELNILNGKRHGTYKSFYENGQIKINSNYINGVLDGSYRHYYENGQIEIDCNYINGKIHGLYKSYYDNGNLKNHFHYHNDILNEDEKFHSFYDNTAKYREGNFGKNGLVKEYFKNGNLKFLKDKNKYTFYDEDNILKCETYVEVTYTGWDNGIVNFSGTWKNYREDGTIDYELDFDDLNSDVKNNIVSKTIFTKGGDFFSKKTVSYKNIIGTHVNYSNEFAGQRLVSEIITKPTTIKGPPGMYNGFTVNVRPIKSIEDIIKFI